MEVSYPARDVFYSQRDRPDTIVRVSVEPGVLGASSRVVFDLILVRGLGGETHQIECTETQQACAFAYAESQKSLVVYIYVVSV